MYGNFVNLGIVYLHINLKIRIFKINQSSWEWWFLLVTSAVWEVDQGGSSEPGRRRPDWATQQDPDSENQNNQKLSRSRIRCYGEALF
jgi:hypothetical protein